MNSGLTGGFHGGLVAHPESATDGGPGVPGVAGLGDEFGAAGGHAVHPLLEGGEGFEDVVGHKKTVTGVAGLRQVCNYGCRTKGTENDERRVMSATCEVCGRRSELLDAGERLVHQDDSTHTIVVAVEPTYEYGFYDSDDPLDPAKVWTHCFGLPFADAAAAKHTGDKNVWGQTVVVRREVGTEQWEIVPEGES